MNMMMIERILQVLLVHFYTVTFSATIHSSLDCAWKFIDQPLSHFERGAADLVLKQRLCIYDEYWKSNSTQPIFLYTGNESPVEEYVNNTGLLWTLAEKHSALVVFAEHRYFGESMPEIKQMPNCISYLNAAEALADYATLSNIIRKTYGSENSPVIAFGGSYGGMLASWLRIMYPSAVAGAIAASAPIWGFPMLDKCPLDGSAQVVTYAASAEAGAAALCSTNLKAAYVLLSEIGSTASGRAILSKSLGLCSPLQSDSDVSTLLTYLQDPLFDLSEGSYPFPSTYITFALTGSDSPLPPWAMQSMCEPLGTDFGVNISGQPENVQFTVNAGAVSVTVDWDVAQGNGYSEAQLYASRALDVIGAALKGVQVWYNVSGTQPACVDYDNSYTGSSFVMTSSSKRRNRSVPPADGTTISPQQTSSSSPLSNVCTADSAAVDPGTAWNLICCNDGLNLINWRAQGVGNDLYWPPNQKKGFSKKTIVPDSLAYCEYYQSIGLYGIPAKRDAWSFGIDTSYGGDRILKSASNIVFSNGNLDPWSPAGVNADVTAQRRRAKDMDRGLSVSYENPSVLSLLIDMGGHHLDLFWEHEDDPASVREARRIEDEQISLWIAQAAQR